MGMFCAVQVLKYVSVCVHVRVHIVSEVGIDIRVINLRRVPKLLTYSSDSISVAGDTHRCSPPYSCLCYWDLSDFLHVGQVLYQLSSILTPHPSTYFAFEKKS